MSFTYYVALPFVRTEEGVAPGEAQEMLNEGAAIRRNGLYSTRLRGCHRAPQIPEESGCRVSARAGDDPSRERIRNPAPEAVGPAFRRRRRAMLSLLRLPF
jgi:hypothetical protein